MANKIREYYYLKYTTNALRVIAWIVLILGVIASLVWGITRGGSEGGIWTVTGLIGGLIGSFLAWLLLLTARELLKLFMDVKENTIKTAERLTKKSD